MAVRLGMRMFSSRLGKVPYDALCGVAREYGFEVLPVDAMNFPPDYPDSPKPKARIVWTDAPYPIVLVEIDGPVHPEGQRAVLETFCQQVGFLSAVDYADATKDILTISNTGKVEVAEVNYEI